MIFKPISIHIFINVLFKFNIKNIVTMINKMMGSFFELDLKQRENGIRFRISLPLNDDLRLNQQVILNYFLAC